MITSNQFTSSSRLRPSKQEWKKISYQSKLLMKQYHKLKLVKDVLIRSTSEYNQIELPSSMQDVVYTELHTHTHTHTHIHTHTHKWDT